MSEITKAEIVLFQPNLAPTHHTLSTHSIVLGRSAECTIPIRDRFLSRHHAEIHWEAGSWRVRDRGSANGTFLNGNRLVESLPLKPGDRITLGDTEILFQGAATDHLQFSVAELPSSSQISIPMVRASQEQPEDQKILNSLAIELIEDRPLNELFDFILDKVMQLLSPSRAAIALLGEDKVSFTTVKMRSKDSSEGHELAISRTLLTEVVEGKKVVAFDVGEGFDEKLGQAMSIIGQSIRSAICAPLHVGESVLGVLYIDYVMTQHLVSEANIRLLAQVSRLAAVKVETTRLRERLTETHFEKKRLEDTLQLAQRIQMRMLPQKLPRLTEDSVFDISAEMIPARSVGGDFYDFYVTDQQILYFCIGDVSGKGVPAALLMAVTRTLFRSLIFSQQAPHEIMAAVNRQLAEEVDPAMFVTAFCAALDLKTGALRYSSAGHNPPLIIGTDGEVRELPLKPGLVLAFMPSYKFADEHAQLEPGSTIYLYTDGITEATGVSGDMFGEERLFEVLRTCKEADAKGIGAATLRAAEHFAAGAPQFDDMTMMCIRYLGLRGSDMSQLTLSDTLLASRKKES